MIALALSCGPRLLIADEPTTALDVTTQAQILDLLRHLQTEQGMALVLITHNLGVVAEMCDQVAVMYLGRVVERGPVDAIFHAPRHPYTRALLRSIPSVHATPRSRLPIIPGAVPHPYNRPAGCLFHPRCPDFMPGVCDRAEPTLTAIGGDHAVSCFAHHAAGTERWPIRNVSRGPPDRDSACSRCAGSASTSRSGAGFSAASTARCVPSTA